MYNPLVTVVIPVYNGSNFVGQAIQSVIRQTYPSIEILVINDGSTDGGATRRVVESFGAMVRYIEKENGGVASALNLAIAEMQGEYLAWLSHDDLFLPEKISKQIEFAKRNQSKIVYSNYEFIDADGVLVDKNTLVGTAEGNVFNKILTSYPFNGCTMLIHKSVFDSVGLFDVNLETTQDYDFWFRCAQIVRFDYLSQVVTQSRIHPNQDSTTKPWMHYECDELYTRISRYIIRNQERVGLSEKELYVACCSLLERRYVSAALMLSNKVFKLKFRLPLLFKIVLLTAQKGILQIIRGKSY